MEIDTLDDIAKQKQFFIGRIQDMNDRESLAFLANVFKYIEKRSLITSPKRPLTKGIREQFAKDAELCHQNGDDALLIPDVFEDENFDWWTWDKQA